MGNTRLKSFKDLEVWEKAVDLAVLIYKNTDKFPRSELYGIVNQMKRAVISISSNLAEGFKRGHNKEKLQFYNIAYASASELESQVEISCKLNFLNKKDYENLINQITEVEKMISGLIKSLNSKSFILNSNEGFTLVELIITIGIISVLAVVGFISIINYKNQQSLTSGAQEIVAVLRNAQDRSISQESGARWGVHFENPSTGADFYDLFQGLSYASGTLVSRNTLPSSVQFDIPVSDSSSTIIFSPISGSPDSSAVIKISLINTPISSSTINVTTNGEIQY